MAEALSLLTEYGGEAKLLAGGQSLVPMLNAPRALIDINRIKNLDAVSAFPGGLRIGALTRHYTVEVSALVQERLPILAMAASQIGHLAIRNRGTLGGSLAHNDPAAIAAVVGGVFVFAVDALWNTAVAAVILFAVLGVALGFMTYRRQSGPDSPDFPTYSRRTSNPRPSLSGREYDPRRDSRRSKRGC